MYFHYQNLKKEDNTKHLLHGRCWIGYHQFHAEWSIPTKFWHIELAFNDYGETAISFRLALGLFSIYLGTENRWLYKKLEKITVRKRRSYTNGRKIGISFHNGTFWFSLWEDPMEWSHDDPKWWKFNFTPMDFFFGRSKYSEESVQEGDAVIEMPEGPYKATYKKFISYWKRPRYLFSKQLLRISIDIPVGIPHPGKGENSWDCGMDATFGVTMSIKGNETIGEICERLVIDNLKIRRKYGSVNDPEYFQWMINGDKRLAEKKA